MINDIGNFGEEPKIVVDDLGKSYMLETARWGKFLGVVWSTLLIIICLFFPVAFKMSMAMQGYPSSGISTAVGIFYLIIMIAVNFYPLYALIKSSNQFKSALNHTDQQMFNNALRLQKNLFKYLGIVTIILLLFYGIIIIFWVTVALTSNI